MLSNFAFLQHSKKWLSVEKICWRFQLNNLVEMIHFKEFFSADKNRPVAKVIKLFTAVVYELS
jgi:hypothetical protein